MMGAKSVNGWTVVAWLVAALAVAAPGAAHAQEMFGIAADQRIIGVGWKGFLDTRVLLEEITALLLATVLGATIAFHPLTPRTVDTLEEAELPKIYIMYSVVGAVIGVTVLNYGMVVGLVVFGLGGLMRFRTDVGSVRDTGRLIVVTLIGLISGLSLPHFAVIATVFVYCLIFLLDAHPICRIVVKELSAGRVSESADVYRKVLGDLGCKVLSERKHFAKPRIEIVFRAPRVATSEKLHIELCRLIPADLRGEIDWEVD